MEVYSIRAGRWGSFGLMNWLCVHERGYKFRANITQLIPSNNESKPVICWLLNSTKYFLNVSQGHHQPFVWVLLTVQVFKAKSNWSFLAYSASCLSRGPGSRFPVLTQRGDQSCPETRPPASQLCLFWTLLKKGLNGKLSSCAEPSGTPLTFLPANGPPP